MENSTPLNQNSIQNINDDIDRYFNPENENQVSPNPVTINRILDYSKSLSIRESNYLGFIENVLN